MTWRFNSNFRNSGLLLTSSSLGCSVCLSAFTTDLAAVIFGESAPDSCILVGHECVLKALHLDDTRLTDRLGICNMCNCRSGLANGEKQIWVGVPTCSVATPHPRLGRFPSREYRWIMNLN